MRSEGPASDGPRSSSAPCPDAGLLVEYAKGALTGADRELVKGHLEACEDCRDVLALWTRGGGSSGDATGAMSGQVGEKPSAGRVAAQVGYPPRPGDVLAGKYTVERVLGLGGMGVVVAAQHQHMGRTVAIKLMLPSAASPETTERFLREARAASTVRSEHVVRVLDVGTLDDGAPFMVMEYLQGHDLARHVREHAPIEVSAAIDYVLQVCEALAEAHALGIVHRDIKPANLFLTTRPDGSALVKVLDFGISKVQTASGAGEAVLTKTQTVMGTPLYMSPEQLRSARSAGPATDVWALGCVLYELLAGRPAFQAESAEALGALIATGPAPRIREVRPDVPQEVENAILACLEKDPARRTGSVARLAAELGRFASPDMARSADRVARISGRSPALPFADTLTSDRPPPMNAATAGSFVRTQGQGQASRGRAGLYAILALGLVGALSGVGYLALRPASPVAAATPATEPPRPAPDPAASTANEGPASTAATPPPVVTSAEPPAPTAPAAPPPGRAGPRSAPAANPKARPAPPAASAASLAPPPPTPSAAPPAPSSSRVDPSTNVLMDRK